MTDKPKFTAPSNEDFLKAQSLPSISINTFSLLQNANGVKLVFSDGVRDSTNVPFLFPRASLTMSREVVAELNAVLEQYLTGSAVQ